MLHNRDHVQQRQRRLPERDRVGGELLPDHRRTGRGQCLLPSGMIVRASVAAMPAKLSRRDFSCGPLMPGSPSGPPMASAISRALSNLEKFAICDGYGLVMYVVTVMGLLALFATPVIGVCIVSGIRTHWMPATTRLRRLGIAQ